MLVTGVGGTTASLSGMEHLVSHMFDMVNGELHEPTGLHGAQVGVGSVIRAAAWEEFPLNRNFPEIVARFVLGFEALASPGCQETIASTSSNKPARTI